MQRPPPRSPPHETVFPKNVPSQTEMSPSRPIGSGAASMNSQPPGSHASSQRDSQPRSSEPADVPSGFLINTVFRTDWVVPEQNAPGAELVLR